MINEQNIGIKFSNSVTGQAKLERYEKTLTSIQRLLSTMNNGFSLGDNYNKQFNSINRTLSNINSNVAKLSNANNKMQSFNQKANTTNNILKTAFDITKIGLFLTSLEKIYDVLQKNSKASATYLENMNLLDVAYNNNTQSADKLVNRLTQMYGLDESWGYRTVGMFKQLSNAMGLADETGTKLSNTLTMLSIDLSSLYNTDTQSAVQKLASALAGQTKPIRSFGADITETTLAQTLLNNNIDLMVRNLSYAEKRLLIVTTILQQTTEAQNDWARTIESVANQERILEEQIQRLNRALGNVMLPLMKTMLPYLNAILMVLVEIINWLAVLVGFNEEDFDFFGEADESINDLIDSMGVAENSVKKLKQGLRNFDKLNVIKTPTSNTSTGSGLGMSPEILNLFNKTADDYLSKLTDVEMKATRIRDKIMTWLGFTKEIDYATGKVTFKYNGFKTTLNNMWQSLKKMSPLARLIVSYFAVLTGKNIINGIIKLTKLLGTTGLYKTIVALSTPFARLKTSISNDLLIPVSSFGKVTSNNLNTWSKTLTLFERFKLTLLGSGGVIVGMTLLSNAMQSVTEKGWDLSSALQTGIGALSTIAGGAIIGSQFGTIGAIIGATTGAIATFLEVYMNYPSEVSKANAEIEKITSSTNEYNDSLKQQYQAINDYTSSSIALSDAHLKLIDELEQIVDENGNVKQGYEERAKFIVSTLNSAYGTEIEIIDGKIKKYQEEVQNIRDIINEKKKQIYLEMAEEGYKVALKEKVNTYKAYVEQQEAMNKAIENEQKARENLEYWKKQNTSATLSPGANLELIKAEKDYEKAKEIYNNAKSTFEDTKNSYMLNVEAIMNYQGLLNASSEQNAELTEYYMKEIENSYNNGKENIKLTLDEQYNDALLYYSSVLKSAKDNGVEVNDILIAQAEERLNGLKTSLTDQKNYINGVTDEQAEAWALLGETNKDKFLEQFATLPDDIQKQIVNKMSEKGYSISSELQAGISQLNPTIKIDMDKSATEQKIKIDADTSEAEKKTNSFWEKFVNNFKFKMSQSPLGTILSGLNFGLFADGGMPDVGQLFVANEKGAELVGHIGGKTFVANQNQMMDLLDKKLGNAQTNKQQVFNIYLDSEHKLATYSLEQLQALAKDNGEPIRIGD